MPVGVPRASRRISNTENGRRSSGSTPAPGLTITNCPGAAAAAMAGAREREHVVIARQRPVRDHPRRDIDRHRGSILQRNRLNLCATCGC